MDKLLEALARSLNMSVDGISDLLSSVKDNTPQLYEQLVKEWTYYTVLSKSSMAMLVMAVLVGAFGIFIYSKCIVDWLGLNYKDVPEDLSRYDYAKLLTQHNVDKNMGTFKKLATIIVVLLVCAFILNISKYILAPNYSIIVNEIIPKLTNK